MDEKESNITRDHIAMEAMKVYLQTNIRRLYTPKNWLKMFFGNRKFDFYTSLPDYEKMAKTCYKIADEMIAARKEKDNEQHIPVWMPVGLKPNENEYERD